MAVRAITRQAAIGVAVVLAAVGCSSGADDSGSDGTSSQSTTVTTTRQADPSTTTPAIGADGSYPSVVTDELIDNPNFDALERRILGVVADIPLPGASLLVVHASELVEQETWGDYTLDTKVPIASASKWLSGALVMTLVEDGLLALDEPIANYIEELEGTRPGSITVRQLLAFTSGLEPDELVPACSDPSSDLQTCARNIISAGLVHDPGTQYRYNSSHLMVAGALAEIVTGQSFSELFEERLAGPLGMTSTRYLHTKDPARQPVTLPNPAGSALSTLGDYARFLEMIVNGGVAPDGTRILTEASIAEMETNQTEGLPMRASGFRTGTKAPYGLGHWIDWTYPDGSTMVSSSPGAFGFRGWIDRENDVFGVYMVQDMSDGNDPDSSPSGGAWIYELSAEAVGGALPKAIYPHRR